MLGPALTPIAATGDRSVAGWWASTSTGTGHVVPDGAVDIIWTPGRTPFVAGPDRAPRPSGLPVGRRVVGVRLRHGVAAAVLGDRVDNAAGLAVALDQVWARPAVERLTGELAAAEGDDARARAIAAAVDRSVADGWHADATVLRAVEAIDAAPFGDPGDLDTEGLGSRQFRRRFSAAIGYGPTFYARIVRLDRFAELAHRHRERSLAELAAQVGFYDQAHLARDTRQLLGTTPSQLRTTP